MARTERKKSQGRQKIEMKLIADESARTVTFSKRRMGLFKKANELSILCGAQIALIIFSLGGRAYSFGHPDVESVLRRFYGRKPSPPEAGSGHGLRIRAARLQELKAECDEKNAQLEAEKKRAREIEAQLEASKYEVTEGRLDRMNVEQLRELKARLENLRDYFLRRAHAPPPLGGGAAGAGPSNAAARRDRPPVVDLANVEKDQRDSDPIPHDWLKL